jgi:hypothetical protein
MKTLVMSAALLLAAPLGVAAQNLVSNPGNELPLVSGEIQGWTEIVGANWTQRFSGPAPFEGIAYFFAGAGATATLRQDVDVLSFAGQIDAGLMAFDFSGRVRSFDQNPPDSATIVVSLLSGGAAVLASFDSGPQTGTSTWTEIATTLAAPVGTRTVRIDLVSLRNAGTNNDGYFDAISLVAAPVPEPSTIALGGLGALLLAARIRRVRRAG